MAIEVSKSGESPALQTRSFDQSTFVTIPTVPMSVKVTSLSVRVTLRRTSEETEWGVQNVAMFVLKNLQDGSVRRFVRFP